MSLQNLKISIKFQFSILIPIHSAAAQYKHVRRLIKTQDREKKYKENIDIGTSREEYDHEDSK